MATTYAFQISMPVTDTLPRNRISNTIHLQHTVGGLGDPDLEAICNDLVTLWSNKYGAGSQEILCKAYDTDAKPNYPRASVIVGQGQPWSCTQPREIALVLSYSGPHRGNKSERGRMYLMPQLLTTGSAMSLRPAAPILDWALSWYAEANESLPDIGGVDWQFGVYSPTYKKFTKSSQAWVNDDWDVQRSRGLRESTRVTSTREG